MRVGVGVGVTLSGMTGRMMGRYHRIYHVARHVHHRVQDPYGIFVAGRFFLGEILVDELLFAGIGPSRELGIAGCAEHGVRSIGDILLGGNQWTSGFV